MSRLPADGVTLPTNAALLALLLLASAVPGPAGAAARLPDAARPAVDAALSDLAWLAGRWVSAEKGTFSEESWSPSSGDSMVGTWRLSVGGRAKLFELLTLLEEEGKVVLRLRHFDRRGVAWEEKDEPLVLPLVAKGRNVAVFEGREAGAFLRLTYGRAGSALTVTLEKETGPARTYRFRRAAAP